MSEEEGWDRSARVIADKYIMGYNYDLNETLQNLLKQLKIVSRGFLYRLFPFFMDCIILKIL